MNATAADFEIRYDAHGEVNGSARAAVSIYRRSDGKLIHDDTLNLLFLCCHPALSPTSAVALTLRAGQPTFTSCQKPKRPATCASFGCGAS